MHCTASVVLQTSARWPIQPLATVIEADTAYTGGAVHSCVGLRLRLKLIAEVEIILSFLLKVNKLLKIV